MLTLHLLKANDGSDGRGETLPIARLDLELFAAGPRKRVKLCPAVVLTRAPLGCDPRLLLELVQGGIEGSVADLEDVGGQLLQPQADGPAIHRLEYEHLENQKVQRSLHEIRWLAHEASPSRLPMGSIWRLLSVSKG